MTLRQTEDRLATSAMTGGSGFVVTDIVAYTAPNGINLYGVTANPDDGLVRMTATADGDLSYVANLSVNSPDASFFFQATQPENPSGLAIGSLLDGDYIFVGGRSVSPDTGGFVNGMGVFGLDADGDAEFIGAYNRGDDTILNVEFSDDPPAAVANIIEISDGADGGDDLLRFGLIKELTFSTRNALLPSSIADQVNVAGEVVATDNPKETDVFIFYLDDEDYRIRYSTVLDDGRLFNGSLSSSATTEKRAPSDMELVTFRDTTLLITSDRQDSTKVYSISTGAEDPPIFKLTDEVGGQLLAGGANHLASFKIGDRAFLVAGESKLTVYELTPQGTLFEMGKADWDHSGVFDIDVAVQDGIASIFVAAPRQGFLSTSGIDTFQFTPGQAQDVIGTKRADTITGDSRDNKFSGRAGADTLLGGDGDDTLIGLTGNDALSGGSGNDTLLGGIGIDALEGGAGNDELIGGASRDVLHGDGGNDTLFGGGGRDRLFDGNGRDIIFGGGGADTFVMTQDRRPDLIAGWQRIDKINLRDYGDDLRFRDLTFIELSDGDLLVRIGRERLELDADFRITADSMVANDFIFG